MQFLRTGEDQKQFQKPSGAGKHWTGRSPGRSSPPKPPEGRSATGGRSLAPPGPGGIGPATDGDVDATAAVLRAEVGVLTDRPLAKGMFTSEESGIYSRAEETCDPGEEFGSHFTAIASSSEAAPDLPELPKDGGLRVTGRSASCGKAIVKWVVRVLQVGPTRYSGAHILRVLILRDF